MILNRTSLNGLCLVGGCFSLVATGTTEILANNTHAEHGFSGNQFVEKRTQPNIIWIMTDQQSATAMSCAGNPYLHTPNMDRLAQRGVKFENAYCAMPLSGPSRAAMFTGYMPSRIGMIENEMPLKDSLVNKTLGTYVKDAGYDCVYAGKWHINTISLPAEEAFGFRKIKDNGDIGLAEACVDFLKDRKEKAKNSSKPFFMVASFTNPHNICEFARGQKPPYADIVLSKKKDKPKLPKNFAVQKMDPSVLQFEKKQNYALYPSVDYSKMDWIDYRDAYFRLVEAVDAEIGKIIDEIDRQNLWEDSIIIFTSDHGDGCGAHQWNQKTVLFEEVANVPLIVCLPNSYYTPIQESLRTTDKVTLHTIRNTDKSTNYNVTQHTIRNTDNKLGKLSQALINVGTDIFPSICEWAQAKVEHRDGRSFCKEAANPDAEGVDYIVTETNFNQTGGTLSWMVRTKDYKYVIYDKGLYREQLFNMSKDRGETKNLVYKGNNRTYNKEYEVILNQHREILKNWLQKQDAPDKKRRLKVTKLSLPKSEM